MLSRKYVFESKTTRLHRLFISGSIIMGFSIAVAISFIVYIPIYGKMQKGRAAGAFFQKSPDAIAVFTGDKGRISYALEHLEKNPLAKLFISGVYATNSFQTLLDKQASSTGEVAKNLGTQVELDYQSKNTFENVAETVAFLKQNPEVKKVLIISSDYHIMRINIIISHFMKGPKKPEFYFDSVKNSYSDWDDVRKLLKEAVKITRTFLILKILREDIVQED